MFKRINMLQLLNENAYNSDAVYKIEIRDSQTNDFVNEPVIGTIVEIQKKDISSYPYNNILYNIIIKPNPLEEKTQKVELLYKRMTMVPTYTYAHVQC